MDGAKYAENTTEEPPIPEGIQPLPTYSYPEFHQSLRDQDTSSTIDNPFEHSMRTSVTSIPSVVSRQSSKKSLKTKLKQKTSIRIIFLAWRAFARQVASDKILFFKLREFIIKRLQKAAYKCLKLNYIVQTLVKHYRHRHFQRVLKESFLGWVKVKALEKKQSKQLESLVQLLEKRIAFHTMEYHSFLRQLKAKRNSVALRFWSQHVKIAVFKAFLQNIQERNMKRENAFKIMIFEERQLKQKLLNFLGQYRMYSKACRSMKFRALRFFSRSYKKQVYYFWRQYTQYTLYRQTLDQKRLEFQYKSSQKKVLQCFQAMKAVKAQDQDNYNRFGCVLERLFMVKGGFQSLQQYSEHIEFLNERMMQRRYFNMVKSYLKYQKEKHAFNHQIHQQRSLIVISKTFSAMKDFQVASIKRKNTLTLLVDRLVVKKAFNSIKHRATLIKALSNISSLLTHTTLHKAFTDLKIAVKLQSLSDTLLWRIRFRQLFSHWKDIALEDKRIQKMLVRAAKHRNRVLRRKAFILWKRQVVPTCSMMPARKVQLLTLCMTALKQNRIKRKVAVFEKGKAIEHHRGYVEEQVFKRWRVYAIQKSRQSLKCHIFRQKQLKMQNQALLFKGLKALKKAAYLRRVQDYLFQKSATILKEKYLSQMREAFIRERTKNFKKGKAMRHYQQGLYFQTFKALYEYRQSKYIVKCRMAQARQAYYVKIARKAMMVIYQYAMRKRQERDMIKQAVFDGQKGRLQQALIQLEKVGVYWASIQKRFGYKQFDPLSLQRKYGRRWRAWYLLRKQAKAPLEQFVPQKQQVIKVVSSVVTGTVAKYLQQKKAIPLVIPKSSIKPIKNSQVPSIASSVRQSFSGTAYKTQPLGNLQQPPSRINEIEQIITNFKQKRLLLKELEEQYKELLQKPEQQTSMLNLIKGKIDALRTELQAVQPHIKELLQEIALLKQGNDTSLVLSSIQGTPVSHTRKLF